MKILSGADKLNGKHISIKNKHFQNSYKFVNFFFLWRVTDPRTPIIYFTIAVFRKNNSHTCYKALVSLSIFFHFTLGKN